MGAHTAWVAELECIADADVQQFTGIKIIPSTDGHIHVVPATVGAVHGVATRDIGTGYQGAFWPIGIPMDGYCDATGGSIAPGDPLAINAAGAFVKVAGGEPYDAIATMMLVSGTANQEVLSQVAKTAAGPYEVGFVADGAILVGAPVELSTAGKVKATDGGICIGVAVAAADDTKPVQVALLAPVVIASVHGAVSIASPLNASTTEPYLVVESGESTPYALLALQAQVGSTTTGLLPCLALAGVTPSGS